MPVLRARPAARPASDDRLRQAQAAHEERVRQARFFATYLRSTNSKMGKPYAIKTIRNYVDAVGVLEQYCSDVESIYASYTGKDAPSWTGGPFETLDAATLNAFFRWYYTKNGDSQGGTNTLQRNLAVFFHWLAEEYEVPDLYAGTKVNRYRPGNLASPVLPDQFIEDLLKVTSGRDYNSVRDHAILRLFLSGIRLEQMARLRVEHLDLERGVAAIAGLKGAPDHPVPFGRKTTLALSRWLRLRAGNAQASDPGAGPLWLGTQNRRPMTNSGIYQMVRRRAVQAGYQKTDIYPHMFRHTRAHLHLADGGSEGDLMRTMGWSSRAMLDRYAKSTAQARAIKDSHERGIDDRF